MATATSPVDNGFAADVSSASVSLVNIRSRLLWLTVCAHSCLQSIIDEGSQILQYHQPQSLLITPSTHIIQKRKLFCSIQRPRILGGPSPSLSDFKDPFPCRSHHYYGSDSNHPFRPPICLIHFSITFDVPGCFGSAKYRVALSVKKVAPEH